MTSQKRLAAAYLLLALLLVILFAANIFWGSVALTPGAVVSALLGRGQDALSVGIITQLRLPRAVMVVLLGAALSAAGYLLQTFFANPIAGPFVMGISSGAKLAVALVIFCLWRPLSAIWGSVLFGALMILYLRLTIPFIPTQLYKILPYVVTLVVLIIVSLRKKREDQPPASLGLSFFREER